MTECRCAKDLAALKELMLEKFEARDTALRIASKETSKKFKEGNQFRDQLTAQAAKFITRIEHEAVLVQIGALQARQSAQETRLLLGGTGIIVVLMTLQLVFNYVLHR